MVPGSSRSGVEETVPPSGTDTRTFLRLASDHAHWLIQLADTKASYLMAASAILAGLLASQAGVACSDGARFSVFLAAALALAAAAATLLVLFPRTTPEVYSSLIYYPAIKDYPSGAEYFARAQTATAVDTDRELAQQVWELARTQDRKFYWLRWAFRLFGLCLLTTLVGVVWAHLPCA